MHSFALALFAALADSTRLRTLTLLTLRGEMCVCRLVSALEVAQPKISRHLASLRQAGLVQDRRVGQWVHYRISETLAPWAAAALAGAAEALASQEPHRTDVQRAAQADSTPSPAIATAA